MLSLLQLARSSAPTPGLETYNIDPSAISVSGFSAGGFMAAQLGIAYSSVFTAGFGAFAGGPYDCARNQDFSTICLSNHTPSIEMPTRNMERWSREGKIDCLANLQHRQVYLEVGTDDDVVGAATTRQLERQLADFVNREKLLYVETQGAAHAFPTEFDSAGNSMCKISNSPFIANCGYDGAGAVLKWLYGMDLKSRKPWTTPKHTVQKFSQTGPFDALGLAETGYIYVPARCQPDGRTPCKLHVALHGCTMSFEQIGDKFIQNTGYLLWADANDIIVLFPQAMIDDTPRAIWNGTHFRGGALACFDWVGWVGENADQRGGVQMLAIVNMVHQLAGMTANMLTETP